MQLRSRKILVDMNEDDPDISCTGYEDIKSLHDWKPEQDNRFLNFCRDSTGHGIKYIGYLTTHFCERLFWGIILLILGIISISSIVDIIEKYNSSPIIVSYQPEEISLDQIPFPAITICNNNVLRYSKIEAIFQQFKDRDAVKRKEANDALQLADHVCESVAQSFSAKFNYSVPDIPSYMRTKFYEDYYVEQLFYGYSRETLAIIFKTIQPCSELVILCLWSNTVKNCSSLFHSVWTDFGLCCQFNGVPDEIIKEGGHNPRKFASVYEAERMKESITRWKKWLADDSIVIRGNAEANLTNSDLSPMRQRKAGRDAALSILVNPEMEEYDYCPLQDGMGFTVLVGSPVDYPRVSEFGVNIRPNTETFLEVIPELTMADKNIDILPKEKRLCYFKDEFKLRFFTQYTMRNCRSECQTNITLKECNCVRIHMARDNTTKLCGIKSYACLRRVEKQLRTEGFKNSCKACLPGCTSINYSVGTTVLPMSPFRNPWMKNKEKELWADKNISIIHIYFGSDSVYSRYRQRVYDLNSLIANAGGFLGLFLGISFVSALEIIYHFFFKILFEQSEDGKYIVAQKWRAWKDKLRTKGCCADENGYDGAEPVKRIFIKSKMNGHLYPWAYGEIIF